MAEKINSKKTGTVIPLGALYTKDNPSIGEFPDLIPFAQFCKKSGLSIIQLLPVNDTGTQSSPYSGLSAFALHPIYIRLSDIDDFKQVYKSHKSFKAEYDSFCKKAAYSSRYDYDYILNTKNSLLRMLYDSTSTGKSGEPTPELSAWIKANPWIKTYAVYKNLKWKYMQASWKSWPDEDRCKSQEEITKLWKSKALKKDHLFYAWCQMVASEQFSQAVSEIHKLGLLLKGDMPILMNEDSCDTWAYPEVFNQELRAGSPADGDNPSGQNWGFPTYNWKYLKENDYSWWKDRLKTAANYYDAYRLDHILGFFRIWAIPAQDCNALNGHTEPYSSFKITDLYELGFDDNRIRWLSQPHIPTSAIENITWNHELAHKILQIFCTRINDEELWLFDKSITGSRQLQEFDFGNKQDTGKSDDEKVNKIKSDDEKVAGINEISLSDEAAEKIKEVLVSYWSNRTLLEVAKNKFIPLWCYNQSTSWASLNEAEKTALTKLFEGLEKKNLKLWQKQADEIFTALTKSVKMTACGEDLGVGIKCVPETMEKHKILGLRVVRWCREWNKENKKGQPFRQPFIPFADYTPLSVTSTSVHDSSTLRQWWEDEKESVKAFIFANADAFGIETGRETGPLFAVTSEEIEAEVEALAKEAFSPEIAEKVLAASASSASIWFIPPLQDLLYMKKECWLENAKDERINIPGTVTKFNWTYRMPFSIEELAKDNSLINKIQKVSQR